VLFTSISSSSSSSSTAFALTDILPHITHIRLYSLSLLLEPPHLFFSFPGCGGECLFVDLFAFGAALRPECVESYSHEWKISCSHYSSLCCLHPRHICHVNIIRPTAAKERLLANPCLKEKKNLSKTKIFFFKKELRVGHLLTIMSFGFCLKKKKNIFLF
jgi:hypothetical protein